MATLLDSTDAMVWAEEFCRIFMVAPKDGYPDGESAHDWQRGLMVSWFANAMAVGEREGAQAHCPHISVIELSDDLLACRACGKLNPGPGG